MSEGEEEISTIHPPSSVWRTCINSEARTSCVKEGGGEIGGTFGDLAQLGSERTPRVSHDSL